MEWYAFSLYRWNGMRKKFHHVCSLQLPYLPSDLCEKVMQDFIPTKIFVLVWSLLLALSYSS